MKTKRGVNFLPLVQTADGETLRPEDGFIVVGAIYRSSLGSDGEPHDGLVGASFESVIHKMEKEGIDEDVSREVLDHVPAWACSKEGLIRGLDFRISDLPDVLRGMGATREDAIQFLQQSPPKDSENGGEDTLG